VRRLLLRALLLPAVALLVLVLPDVATAGPDMRTAPRAYGWPLSGTPTVDRGFQPPRTAWGSGHRGVDLRAAPGAPVLAAGPGRVSYAGLLAGRGVVAVVHAGGLRTTYEPVTATVHVGETVARGDVLGVLADGHASCRAGVACLHWGLLRGDTYLDPLVLLGGHDVRLLPLHVSGRSAQGADAPPAGPAAAPLAAAPAARPRAPLPSAVPAALARPAGSSDLPQGAVPGALALAAAGGWAARRRRPT
jgi:murein DD-endopeptidase MepM/ murein hydrolase activator NlpD